MSLGMDTSQFDKAMITAVFQRAALVGWRETTLAAAARDAALDLPRVRMRFPGKTAVLLRFGVVADQAMLAGAPSEGLPRERLFDLLMLRFDQLQQHRDGMLALMQALRTDPATTLLLYGATLRSMRWALDAAEVPTDGPLGALRVHGLAAVWAYAMRAWQMDEGSADLPATMAAVDRGLDRAMQAEGMLNREPVRSFDDVAVDAAPADEAPPMLSGAAIVAAEDGPAVL